MTKARRLLRAGVVGQRRNRLASESCPCSTASGACSSRRHPQPRPRSELADHRLSHHRLRVVRLGARCEHRHCQRVGTSAADAWPRPACDSRTRERQSASARGNGRDCRIFRMRPCYRHLSYPRRRKHLDAEEDSFNPSVRLRNMSRFSPSGPINSIGENPPLRSSASSSGPT